MRKLRRESHDLGRHRGKISGYGFAGMCNLSCPSCSCQGDWEAEFLLSYPKFLFPAVFRVAPFGVFNFLKWERAQEEKGEGFAVLSVWAGGGKRHHIKAFFTVNVMSFPSWWKIPLELNAPSPKIIIKIKKNPTLQQLFSSWETRRRKKGKEGK